MSRQQAGGVSPALLNQTAQMAPPQAPPMPGNPGPSMGPAQPGQASPEQPKAESELIIKALSQRLSSISKVQEQGGSQSTQAMPVGY